MSVPVRPPSIHARVLVSLAFLVGFYVVMLGAAASLLAAVPLAVAYGDLTLGLGAAILFVVTWIPALLLLRGIASVRPPKWEDPGPRIPREQAPELYAIVDELAARAGTEPPLTIYLTPLTDLGVTETGGVFGFGSRRVLVLGAPLLSMLTRGELRAALAHELGHFTGGDTRLRGIVAYTLASFRAVAESARARRGPRAPALLHLGVEASRALTLLLVRAYSSLYFSLTRPTARRQELAADVLAAELAGKKNLESALEKVDAGAPMYDHYVTFEVGVAVRHGAMPVDLLDGFRIFSERFVETDVGRAFLAHSRGRPTHAFDTHPALAERLLLLAALPEGDGEDDARSAADLVTMEPSTEAWLVTATLALFGDAKVTKLPWRLIPGQAIAPTLVKSAQHMATALRPLFPDEATLASLLAAVVAAFERGEALRIAATVEPALLRFPPEKRGRALAEVGATLLSALLQGAILEKGGVIDDSLGLPDAIFRWEGEALSPLALARAAMVDRKGQTTLLLVAQRLALPLRPAGTKLPSRS